MTKRTYTRKTKLYAKESEELYYNLIKFAKAHCKKREMESFLDELTQLIDSYINFNCKVYLWCNRYGVDVRNMFEDLNNAAFEQIGNKNDELEMKANGKRKQTNEAS